MVDEEMCACGKPLHYTSPDVQARVQELVDRLGPDIKVHVAGKSHLVPRHYIALHGLTPDTAMTFPEAPPEG